MKKNDLSIYSINPQENFVEIERTREFIVTAGMVSDYLKSLPLTAEQNDKLVELMIKHTQAAERSGYVAAIGRALYKTL